MMNAIILAVLALGPVRSESRLRTWQASSIPLVAPVAYTDWSTVGSSSWYGAAQAATVDCIPDSGMGTISCTGATATPVHGASMSTVGTPWYPRGFGATSQPAINTGTNGAFTLGNVTVDAHLWTMCAETQMFVTETVWHFLTTRNGNSFYIAVYNGNWRANLYNSGWNTHYVGSATSIGAWDVWCLSVTDNGNSTMTVASNFNGAADTPDTFSGGGTVQPGSTPMSLGANADANDYYFKGHIGRFTLWNGWAASAAQMKSMVGGMIGKLTTSPVSDVTFTRAGYELCCASYSSCRWVGTNMPCVTPAGLSIWNTGSNFLLQSQTLATGSAFTSPWSAAATTATVTTAANATTAPDYTATADSITVTNADSTTAVTQPVTVAASTAYTFSGWIWTDAGTKTAYVSRTNGSTWASATVQAVAVTTTPARFALTYTSSGVETASSLFVGSDAKTPNVMTDGTYYLWGLQHNNGAFTGPYTPTVASTVVWPATVASMPWSVTGTSWALSQTFTPAIWNQATTAIFGLGTSNAANSTKSSLVVSGNHTFITRNAANATRTNTYNLSLTDATQHVMLFKEDASIYADGAVVSGTLTGTGTGIETQPNTLYIGQSSTGSQTNCKIKKIVQCTSRFGCR